MATAGDRVTEKATGRTGVVAAHGRDDAVAIGRTLVIWDDAPTKKHEVADSDLAYEEFILVRQTGGKTLSAAVDGTETTDLAKATRFNGRERGQRFKNEKSQFSSHEPRPLRECE
jgi:hypothetical protein